MCDTKAYTCSKNDYRKFYDYNEYVVSGGIDMVNFSVFKIFFFLFGRNAMTSFVDYFNILGVC